MDVSYADETLCRLETDLQFTGGLQLMSSGPFGNVFGSSDKPPTNETYTR